MFRPPPRDHWVGEAFGGAMLLVILTQHMVVLYRGTLKIE